VFDPPTSEHEFLSVSLSHARDCSPESVAKSDLIDCAFDAEAQRDLDARYSSRDISFAGGDYPRTNDVCFLAVKGYSHPSFLLPSSSMQLPSQFVSLMGFPEKAPDSERLQRTLHRDFLKDYVAGKVAAHIYEADEEAPAEEKRQKAAADAEDVDEDGEDDDADGDAGTAAGAKPAAAAKSAAPRAAAPGAGAAGAAAGRPLWNSRSVRRAGEGAAAAAQQAQQEASRAALAAALAADPLHVLSQMEKVAPPPKRRGAKKASLTPCNPWPKLSHRARCCCRDRWPRCTSASFSDTTSCVCRRARWLLSRLAVLAHRQQLSLLRSRANPRASTATRARARARTRPAMPLLSSMRSACQLR
jgi:hypothetical protein